MRRTLLLGAAAALIYFIGAAITSHLNPLESRPVLDGIHPPPPYRWVEPPADLAAQNKKPFPGKFSMKFTGGKSPAGAFTTRDTQLSMILDPGALPVSGNATSAAITVTPLGASSFTPPPRYQIDGNVYRIAIKEQPSGALVTKFAVPERVVLVYPADKSFLHPKHILATSSDGKTWTKLKTADSNVQQQASALIGGPGLLAVLIPKTTKSSARSLTLYIVIGVVILLVAAALGWWLYRRRQASQPRRRR